MDARAAAAPRAAVMTWIAQAARSSWALPLAVLAALVVFVISEATYYRSRVQLANISTQAEVRAKVQNVLRLMLDAETGQRGYLLTGRPEYLAPYHDAIGQLDPLLRELSAFFADDPAAAATMHELDTRGREKLSELAAVIQERDEGRDDAWRDLLLTDIGREKMSLVRTAGLKLFALQDARVAMLRQRLFDIFLVERIGVDVMAALSLFSFYLFLRQRTAFDEARKTHASYMESERQRLEDRVAERTRELARRTRELALLTRHLQTAREDERARLARELHDELGSLMTAAKLDVARLKRALGAMAPQYAERLQHINQTIDQGIALKRDIIENLRPSSLSNLGLTAALQIQAREFAQRSGLEVLTHLESVQASDAVQITIYRFVQESFTNIAKHAQARNVTLEVSDEAGRIHVRVQDDGRGFDKEQSNPSAHGLLGMRYRVESEGGELRLSSTPGKGTLIEAWLPVLDA